MRRVVLLTLVFVALVFPGEGVAQDAAPAFGAAIPMGEAAVMGDYSVRVTAFASDATEYVVARFPGNAPPDDGYVYALASLVVTYLGKDVGTARDLTWHFMDADRTVMTDVDCSSPDRPLAEGTIKDAPHDSDIFPGGWVEFEQCLHVPATQAGSLVMYMLSPEDEWTFFELGEGDASPEASPESRVYR